MSKSPIARLIMIGQQAVNQAIAGKPCPLCLFPAGQHKPGCLVGEALLEDPLVASQARAAKERR